MGLTARNFVARLARGVMTLVLCAVAPMSAFAADSPSIEADRHFQSGVAAFQAQRFAEAVNEFASAYRIAPTFQVLYNIGQVNSVLDRHAEALGAFEAYLHDGGAAIAASRRAEVEAEMLRLRALVGVVRVAISPAAAVVTIDGTVIGSGPFARPVFVEPGRHTISANLSGYSTAARVVSVAAGGEAQVDLFLEPVGTMGAVSVPPHTMLSAARSPGVAGTPPHEVAPALWSRSHGGAQRTTAYVVGAGGAGLLFAGTLLAVTGADKANTARNHLAEASTGSAWDATKVDYDSGATQNDIGWVVAAVGAASATAAVILYATAPGTSQPWSVGIATVPSPLMSRVAVVGSW